MNLDIHLDGSDTIMSSGNLEIHISKEVFQPLNICKDQIIVISISGHKTCGDTSYRFLNRNTSCHQRQGGGTHAGL